MLELKSRGGKKWELDVCLVWPGIPEPAPPFGAMSIASVLEKEGFSVEIADFAFEEIDETIIRKKIKEEPMIIGVTAYSTPMISRAICLTRILKELFPESFFIWGGVHPTIFPDTTLKQMDLDAVCIGEGEYTMRDLVKCLKNGGKLQDVDGLCFKSGENIVFTGSREPIKELDSLPWYAWHLIDMRKYSAPTFLDPKRRRRICLMESRGCPYRCSYCYAYKMFGPRWRGRSVEKVLEEIKFLYSSYGIEYFNIFDDLPFGGNPKKMNEFCRGIRKISRDIIWDCDHRVNLVNRKLITAMKSGGCTQIYFGVESGSPRILKLLNRTGITIQNIVNAFDICFDVGVKTIAGFMVGLPTETEKDIEMSIELAKRIPATQFRVSNYVPYAGTDLYRLAIERGFKVPENLETWAEIGDYKRVNLNFSEVDFSTLKRAKRRIESLNIPNALRYAVKYKEFRGTLPILISAFPEEMTNILGRIIKETVFYRRI